MQDKDHYAQAESNVFIEFQVVKDSDPVLLSKELDLLIVSGKQIHVWSKTVSVKEMKRYCISQAIDSSEEEIKLHAQAFVLRHQHKKTYKEIADILKVPIERIGYYTKVDPLRKWTLNDWIVSYQIKDSTIYGKVDFLVDNDEKLVDRFKRAGRSANYIKKVPNE